MMYVHGVLTIRCGRSSKEGGSKVYQGWHEDGASSMRMNMKYPSSSSELVQEDESITRSDPVDISVE